MVTLVLLLATASLAVSAKDCSSGTDMNCCSSSDQCDEGEGDCDSDADCKGDLVCSDDFENCRSFNPNAMENADCCAYSKDRKFALERVPILRFDHSAGDRCFPDFASDKNDRKCKEFNKNAPIYYDFVECNGYAKLVWWMWYGWQKPCDGVSLGTHGNDWEHITVNFIKKSGNWVQDSVTRYQHYGWFTRNDVTKKPWIWVGKNSHGSYDEWCKRDFWNPFGTHACVGGCGYWEDFRNQDHGSGGVVWSPHNIQHIRTITKGTSQVIKERVDGELYFANKKLNKCNGSSLRLATTSGCWRNNHEFPAPVCDDK